MENYYEKLSKLLSSANDQNETTYNEVLFLLKRFIFLDDKNAEFKKENLWFEEEEIKKTKCNMIL